MAKIVRHPDYVFQRWTLNKKNNDVALLYLSRPSTYPPIKLAPYKGGWEVQRSLRVRLCRPEPPRASQRRRAHYDAAFFKAEPGWLVSTVVQLTIPDLHRTHCLVQPRLSGATLCLTGRPSLS